ncbi:winged helix DNA-binding domain-containing protein [Corynebacterium nasicanis]
MDQLAELRARRIVAQGLPSSGRSAAAAARWMLGVQGQKYADGIRALSLRGPRDDAAVLAVVDKLEIVRAWPMRGTLHFLPAEDVRWMTRLCGPQVARAQKQRRPGLGLSEDAVVVAREALHSALRGGALTRPEIYEVFAGAGVDPGDGRGPHLVRAFGGEGDVVQGPRRGAVETFLHVDDLPAAQRELEGDAALAELGTRYLHSHGPASVKDLVWWAGITVAQARRAVGLARDVVEFGDGYWMGEWQRDVPAAELERALEQHYELPAFDEILLGYGDKSLILPDALRPEVLTKNGISWPFTMRDGVITGRTT